jgi:hypothetical protein
MTKNANWADDHSGKLTDHPISEKGNSQDLARIMHCAVNNGFYRHPINFLSRQLDPRGNLSEQPKKIPIFFSNRKPKQPCEPPTEKFAP